MKKIICIILAILMIFSLTACNNNKTTNNEIPKTENPNQEINVENSEFSNFDSSLINYLNENLAEGTNYMVSPLSFRYALALATMGAKGDTQTELLKATGFKTMDDYVAWCNNINGIVSNFDADLQNDIKEFENYVLKYDNNATGPDRKLLVANSIWHNESYGKLLDNYLKETKAKFNATAKNLPLSEFRPQINEWINENTNGLIPTLLSQDPSDDLNTILVNTLYLKSNWLSSFNDRSTKEGSFTTYNDKKVTKEFMNQQDKFKYYEDKDTQIVILPLEGNINVAFILGNEENIIEKIKATKLEEVKVKIPKFEIETSLENKQLCEYLKKQGVLLAFDKNGQADFSGMTKDQALYIGDIMQKTKIKVDEEGLEAAAVTAIMMGNATAIMPEENKIYEFNADRPFSFYIYTENENELLFYGKYNR